MLLTTRAPYVSAILLSLTQQAICHQQPIADSRLAINGIPYSTRAYWMRRANQALADLVSPCPFGAFGTAIVNHTAAGLGSLVCIGANSIAATGNPILHGVYYCPADDLTSCADDRPFRPAGEIAAINNCSALLTDAQGPHRLTARQAQTALASLSLYTNAESCPMCASAVRWAGFKEYIYGTSIDTLIAKGWGQIRIGSMEVFENSFDLATATRLIGGVLANETDPYFSWQYDSDYPCPMGCARREGSCAKVEGV